MDVMERSAAGPGRQSRSLPCQHAAGEVLVVAKPVRLCGQRRGHRPLPGPACENHLFAFGVRNVLRVETGERNDDGVRIGFHRHFVRLADVDQKVTPFGDPLRYVCRRQIVYLIRH
jgi:hypothetical protein